MKQRTKLTQGRLLASTIFAGSALIASPAFAQVEPQTEETVAETAAQSGDDDAIIITGTLIQNPNLVATAPVNTVGEEEIELQQANVAEELLRELPGAVPSIGSAVNNGNGGASFVNLRGLGSNRNIVLLDGVRIVPAELLGRVDLNNIPLALIQRVDTLTGGASTTYGADAISGVVNFITRRDFAGLDVNLSNQITELGDGHTFRADVTMGANFDDGRGNATLSVGYQEADPVYQGAREISLFGISSTTGAGGGSGTTTPSRFLIGPGTTRQVNPEGTAFEPTAAFSAFNFNPFNVYQVPFERFNIYGAANYEVSDALEIYTRGLFSKNTVDTIIAPSGAFGIGVTIPINNPFLTAAQRNSFCQGFGISAADCAAAANGDLRPGDAAYREVDSQLFRRAVEVGPRVSSYTTQIFDYRLGARGGITDSVDWDLFGAYGESDNLQSIDNYTLNSRVEQSLLAGGTAANPVCFDTSNGCVPVNFFGATGNSSFTPEAIDFLSDSSTVATKVSLAQARATISGDVGWVVPFASDPISFAVGGEYRAYTASQVSDTLAQGGDLGGSGGASPNIDGGFDVYEAFGELIVPLIQDRPFFDEVVLEGGIRYSSYNVDAAGAEGFNTTTWKVGGSWAPFDGLRFRGTYAHAVRAPNIAELFSPVNTVLTNLTDDPCASINDSGVRFRDPPTGELRAICLAQGATTANVDAIPAPIAGQANVTGGGNLNLQPETSNSWTVGAVFNPDFVPGLSLSLDYYHIKVKGAITAPTPDDVLDICFGQNPLTPPAGASQTEGCTSIQRNPFNGGLSGDPSDTPGLPATLSNLGVLETSGIDFIANYSRDLGFAGLDLGLVLNWTDESKFQAVPTGVNRECIGFYSANCLQPNPEWMWSQRTTLTFGDIDVSLLWRHIAGVTYEPDLTPLFSGTLPAALGSLAGREEDFNEIPSYDYFDLTTRIAVDDNFTVTLAVQNLFNKEPPIVGGEAGSTTFNSGNTFPSTYDALGRRYVASARIRF
jgi:iron complex outermembrane recepter protein